MQFLAGLITAAGLIMLFKPDIIWYLSEKWKSAGADEPSSLYIWSARFGGAICTLIGLGSIIFYYFLH